MGRGEYGVGHLVCAIIEGAERRNEAGIGESYTSYCKAKKDHITVAGHISFSGARQVRRKIDITQANVPRWLPVHQ